MAATSASKAFRKRQHFLVYHPTSQGLISAYTAGKKAGAERWNAVWGHELHLAWHSFASVISKARGHDCGHPWSEGILVCNAILS